MNLLLQCWKPSRRRANSITGGGSSSSGGGGGREGNDDFLWSRDIGKYGSGDFSMAVVQGNEVLEDQCQIESGPLGTFVGIYDGHGGPEASRYVCDHLFRRFQAISAQSQGVVTDETIQGAFLQTEEGITALVSDLWNARPLLATNGSCCLVGVIFQQTLFVANAGDSRVVLGKRVGNTRRIEAIQLSTEHNANLQAIRDELRGLHPNDPEIVILKHGVWRVKGIIQVSRSIGDAYMKDARFNREPIPQKFRLDGPLDMPYMTANPSMHSRPLEPNDSFLIFASDGLWEYLSNERAVDIVHRNPRQGIAKRLAKAALKESARLRQVRYSEVRRVEKSRRRNFHDDISVIVLFLNHDLISRGAVIDPPLSVRSALNLIR